MNVLSGLINMRPCALAAGHPAVRCGEVMLADVAPLQRWRSSGAGIGHAAHVPDAAAARSAAGGRNAPWRPPADDCREAGTAAVTDKSAGSGRRSTASGNVLDSWPHSACVSKLPLGELRTGVVTVYMLLTGIVGHMSCFGCCAPERHNMACAGSSAVAFVEQAAGHAAATAATAGSVEGGFATCWRHAAGPSFPACHAPTSAGAAQRTPTAA